MGIIKEIQNTSLVDVNKVLKRSLRGRKDPEMCCYTERHAGMIYVWSEVGKL